MGVGVQLARPVCGRRARFPWRRRPAPGTARRIGPFPASLPERPSPTSKS
jgi:hypothetical protein